MPAIRLAEARDAAAIAEIYAPHCLETPVSFEEAAPAAEEMAARIARVTRQYPWLVLEHEGALAGYAYGGTHRERAAYRWSVEVTVYVARGWHRRGVGRALYTALFDLLAQQGYQRAFGGVTIPNAGSEGLHEAMGFTAVGTFHAIGHKFGLWHDVRWYERDLRPLAPSPAEPRPVGELLGTPGWNEAMARGLACLAPAP
jgi:phosphinothricin acetyltransferase